MFKKNTKHVQENLFSFINTLPERQKKLLIASEEYSDMLQNLVENLLNTLLFSGKMTGYPP